MRLVAQRVRSPNGAEGINAFCYLHGAITWIDQPPKDLPSGLLMSSHVEVRPPGNRVRSYLDILAPDDTPTPEIEKNVADSVDLFKDEQLPLNVEYGGTNYEFNVELALAPAWRRELLVLLHRALEVRV